MQPTYITVGQLFGSQTRHTVPLFQRPYVWNREEQWEPLWEDIAGLIERVASRIGDVPVAGHFLGTVVLEQAVNPTGSLPRREVIDGQQRLTTIQLLLKAAEHSLAICEQIVEGDADRHALGVARRQIAFLTENPAYSADEEKYKVWPTNEDRAPFQAVLDSQPDRPLAPNDSRMAEAYGYFRSVFLDYLSGTGSMGPRAQNLAAALKDHLRLIVLDLDATDEPQAIFETLNAHGTPLLPADLIKNWLLWEAARYKLPATPLYEEYWRPFDREHAYWRERIGVGHAARARVDTFLQNWLTRRTLEPVSAKHLYDRFLRFTASLRPGGASPQLDVQGVMADIRSNAVNYESIDAPSGNRRFDIFLRRLGTLDVVVLHPVLLAIMDRPGSDQADLDAIALLLESYLVRRMICGYQTRGYGALAVGLLKAIADLEDDMPAAQVIAAHLLASPSGADTWPDDEMFREEWMRRRFYNGLRRDRVLMILQALEEQYQRTMSKSEPVLSFDFSQLQIEHVLPQKWQEHWPLDPELGDAANRDFVIHGIGNLTLVSSRLNPSLSNAPWTDSVRTTKRAALEEHSKLELNRRLLASHAQWNESAIRQRAQQLFEVARLIWPRPAEVPEEMG